MVYMQYLKFYCFKYFIVNLCYIFLILCLGKSNYSLIFKDMCELRRDNYYIVIGLDIVYLFYYI